MPEPAELAERPLRHKLYSAPRRFDLSTMLVVMTAYAMLFAGMKALGLNGLGFVMVGGVVTFVGVAQSLLHAWGKPRTVSVLAFLLCYSLVIFRLSFFVGMRWDLIWYIFSSLLFGVAMGYLCGSLVGGVFLVADFLRRGLLGQAPSGGADEKIADESPWDDPVEPLASDRHTRPE